ncbi:MAG TPA: VOC family protein [Fimbriimonadaceae bacterium]|nr:VOC family protein [Fimbriimonadaceae bacterium]
MPHPFPPKLAQVAFVVRDIEKARHRFAALLGVEPPEIVETRPGSEVDLVYRGRPSDAQAKLAFIDLENVQIELIEPIGEDSAWADGLAEDGERLHHLAFWTESVDEASAHIERQDVPMVMRGAFNDLSGEYLYFDGQKDFGCFIELLALRR